MDYHTGGKWFIHSTKCHEEKESIAQPGMLLVIVLSSVFTSDIKEVYGNVQSIVRK